MALQPSYPASVNSRQTELADAIDDIQTSFTVLDGSVLPPAPNLLTLGTDESAETVLYTGLSENEVTGITRGFESAAKSWAAGTKLARYFTAYDHNTTRQNIAYLDQRVSDIVIPPASLTEQGIVMLSKSTTGSRDDVAATESAVAAAFQYGVERKAEVVAALNSIGVSASTSESWDSLIAKMSGVIRATGTAAVSQVLAGSTFSNASGNNRTGTMPNRGAGGTITPGTTAQVKAAGYYNTDIVVPGEANLRGDVILKNYSIYGVAGKYEPNQVVNSPITLYSTGVVKPARYLHWLTIPTGKSFFFVPSFTNAYISFNSGSETNPLSGTNIVLIDSLNREVAITFNSGNGPWVSSTIYITFIQVDRVNRRYRYSYKPTISSSISSSEWITPGGFDWDNEMKLQFQYLNQSVVTSQGTNTVIIPNDAFSVYY